MPSSDGKRYSQYPDGDYPSVGLSLVVRSMDQTAGDGGTITIPRYATVHFDLSGSTASTLDTPFVQLLAHHDYGYATPTTPGSHTQSGLPRGNDVGGLIRAHTYLTAGTYEYSVRVKVPSGGYSEASCTIVVQEPSDYFTNTVAISSGGAWPTWASDTLYTMADNLDCTGKGNLNIATGNPGVSNVWIMGNPSAPAVVSGTVTVGRNNPGSANISESYCIGFIGITGATEIGVDYGRSVYYHGVSAENIEQAANEHYSTYGGSNFNRPSCTAFSKCTLVATTTGIPHFTFLGEEYLSLIDCSLDYGTYAGAGHVLRTGGLYGGVIQHCKMFGMTTDGAYVTVRPRGATTWARGHSAGSSIESRRIVVADNVLGDATDSVVGNIPTSAKPVNSTDIAYISDVVWISNTYTNEGPAGAQLNFAGKRMGVMNCTNIIAGEISGADETGYTNMQAADFYPYYSEHGFSGGYVANEKIQLPAFEDPGKAGT